MTNSECIRVSCAKSERAKKGCWYFSKATPKRGKKISQEAMDLAVTIYEDDGFSCQIPGVKYCVSIGNTVEKQKCLVLCNIGEDFPNSAPCLQNDSPLNL